MRLLKLIVALILLGVAGLAGYAYFGDMEPRRAETRTPIAGPSATPAPAADAPTDAEPEGAPRE